MTEKESDRTGGTHVALALVIPEKRRKCAADPPPGDASDRGALVRLTPAGHERSLQCPHEQFIAKLASELREPGNRPVRAVDIALILEERDGFAGAPGGPPVVSWIRDSHRERLLLDVRPEFPCFSGHFAGNPILPGVVQLHWAAIIAGTLLGYIGAPREISRLKFRHIATPPCFIELQMEHLERSSVSFELVGHLHAHAQGVLAYDGRD